MKNEENLLPLGSVVLLEEGLQKLMVIGRGAIYLDETTGAETFADYMAVMYPAGMNPQSTLFFNNSDVDKVLFTGFVDEDEARFLEVYEEWKTRREQEQVAGVDVGAEQNFGF